MTCWPTGIRAGIRILVELRSRRAGRVGKDWLEGWWGCEKNVPSRKPFRFPKSCTGGGCRECGRAWTSRQTGGCTGRPPSTSLWPSCHQMRTRSTTRTRSATSAPPTSARGSTKSAPHATDLQEGYFPCFAYCLFPTTLSQSQMRFVRGLIWGVDVGGHLDDFCEHSGKTVS